MRVLVVDEEIPFPLNSGKRLRTFNLLKHLSTRHKITFICRHHEGAEEPNAKAFEKIGINVAIVRDAIQKKEGLIFYLRLFTNLFSKYPYVATSHYSKLLIETIKNLTEKKPFDLVHCEWTPYAINLAHLFPMPSVVVAHNVESMIWRRYFETESNFIKKMYIYIQWKKMEKFERSFFPIFSRTIAVSDNDKNIISQWMEKERIDIVANGVDVDFFRPSGITKKPYSLVFTGALDWRPNIDCIQNFIDETWPLVLNRFPKCSLNIIGRRPMPALLNKVKKCSSVHLIGDVDDIRPFIEESSVYIVPLRVGGGSRLKILEALSMEMPVVSTAVGAEGLEVVSEEHLLIADSPTDFVGCIERLFSDSNMREKLGIAGRSLVEKKYQWSALAQNVEEIWTQAISQSNNIQ